MLRVTAHYVPMRDAYEVRFSRQMIGVGKIQNEWGPSLEYTNPPEPGVEISPAFTLREDEAQALYHSLGKALGIAGDPDFVAKRLEVETKRLDKVLDWMMRP